MKWLPILPAEPDLPPEGWLGDPNEWPSLFLRNHVVRQFGRPTGKYRKNTVYVYMTLENYGEMDLEWDLLSALPDEGRRQDKMTWLEFETQINDPPTFWASVREALGGPNLIPPTETPNADWALQAGICPEQWFILRLTPDYITYPASENGPEEYDFEVDAELISAQWLNLDEHQRRWTEFLFESALDDGRPRYEGG